ncbi:MAG TPA: 30S ribosomal protein S6, partial [Terriglobales bacterium]|nr:30S ribosomal protein S6 [Terriglobales bacterium]
RELELKLKSRGRVARDHIEWEDGEKMNRTYELMFIVRPDMVEEEQDKLIATLETAVTSSGGNVKSVEKMGKRRLAYMVRRFHDGIYVLLTVEGGGGLIHELERRLRVTEPVIKFITVRIDEEQKRLDKIKAIRDAKRKTPPPAPVAEAGGETAAVTA